MGVLSPSRHVRAQTILWASTFVLQYYGRRHLLSDTNPDGDIQQPLRFRRKLMSSTVTNVGPLRRLLPVGSRFGTLVRRATRQDGMGRDHLLNEARARPYQDQRTCAQHGAIPGSICRVSRARSEEKEDPAHSKDLLCLWFFFFLPSVILAPPWSIKGRTGHPTRGRDQFDTHHTYSQVATKLLASFRPFHRRLETCPSLDRLYPLLRTFFGANKTSSSRLDVGIFCPNQYKPCVLQHTIRA